MPPKTRRGAAYIVESQAESQNNEQEQHQPEQSIPDVEARQTNLLLELIQGLQQTQGELAKTVQQLKEKSSKAKNDHQDGENHHEYLHQEPSSHNNKAEPFITLSEVADLLQQEREKILNVMPQILISVYLLSPTSGNYWVELGFINNCKEPQL
jgi:hypothetical protein